jgi:hypothetical protein
MSRLCVETRGICNWRDRLASPETQWRRTFSAFETAVAWELAERTPSGLPEPIAELFRGSGYGEPLLAMAVAEHKVVLAGRGGDSQCDVWGLVKTDRGLVSMSVEAKASEGFGNQHEPLRTWLDGGRSAGSAKNRRARWDGLAGFLPVSADYMEVPFQVLHRCGAAVVEARRMGLEHAAFVVQAFNAPESSFEACCRFGAALGVPLERNRFVTTTVAGRTAAENAITLLIGWADCAVATDEQVAAVAAPSGLPDAIHHR